MNKKNIRVSDAIPEMPLSFDRTVEQTLRRVCGESKQTASPRAASAAERSTNDDTPNPRRKHWFSKALQYAATAAMLVAILAVGGILVKSAFRSTSKPAAHAPSASAKVSIRLLPELEDAELCAKAREDAQQPAFSEEDWGWIRKIDVSIESFEYTEDTLQWTTVFRIKPQNRPAQWAENPFETGDAGSLRILEDGTTVFLNGGEEPLSVNTETWTEIDADGSWLVYVGSQAVLSDLPLYDGVAPVRQQFRLIDRAVDDWATSATVAVIEQTFSVDLTLFSTTPQPNGLSPTPQPQASMPNASPEPPIDGVSYYYLVNGVPVYPYENFLYEDKDGLSADGMSIQYQLEDEKVRRAIPKVLYDPDASFGIAVTDGWKLMEFAIFDSRYNRIGTVGRADLKETEPGVYSVPEQLKTLSPGIYYLNAIVAKQDGGASRGNELVIGLNVGGVDDDDLSDRTPQPTPTPVTTIKLTPAPQEEPNPKHIPMICYNDELYGMHDEIRPDAPDADAASGTVTSVVWIGEIPETDGQANFGSIGMRFYVARDGLVVRYNDEWRLFVAEELGDDPDNVLWNDPNAFPGLFKFWDYDEVIGYREAPAEGVLFVCDFDGDGKEEEIRYQKHGQYLTISLGKKSVEVNFGAGLEQVILLDLDPDSARLNLLVIYNTGSEDYETAELHMENGRFVRGPVIRAYCSFDGNTVRGSATQTDILGTKFGGRTYHGEKLTPDSEWFDCDVIPDEIQSASDRERLIEGGKLLHLVRDLPCTIDGADAMIPAGSYIYMTRWHESGTLAEIRTEDGTTALLTVERADLLDPELYGYLIDGEMQDTYFDNIFYAD